MSKGKKLIIFAIVAVVIVALVVVNLKKGKGGEIEVTVERVKKGDITQVVSGSGKVQPETEVKISANVAGEIVKLPIKEGDQVRKGQLLVELERTRYEAAADRAKSNLKSAEANLQKAKADYTRVQELYDKKLASQADLDASQAALQLAESEVEQANASLKQAQDDLAKTSLISPIDGIVTQLNKEEGEIALGSQFQADVIMTVADLSRMEVLSEIDENDVVMVNLGDKADIEVDAVPDTIFEGRVSEIAHTATTRGRGTQEEVTNFEVKAAVQSMVEKLRPGMSATVDIETEIHKDVLHVPIQCVTVREPQDTTKAVQPKKKTRKKKSRAADTEMDEFMGDEGPGGGEKSTAPKKETIEVVFVVDKGLAKMVPVTTGISNDTDIEIKSGLQEGQEVITGSYKAISKLLKDGSKVKLGKKPTAGKKEEK